MRKINKIFDTQESNQSESQQIENWRFMKRFVFCQKKKTFSIKKTFFSFCNFIYEDGVGGCMSEVPRGRI
jgi:hypothetical protein